MRMFRVPSATPVLVAAMLATISTAIAARVAPAQDAPLGVARSSSKLELLVGPVALYADPLLAQLLLATTFPDQVRDAADYVRANGTDGIDTQSWDVSVKAIAHYPAVLNLLDSKPEWMGELGQAYAAQSSEVMAAVQRLRQQAVARGNLVTTPQQQVVVEPTQVAIWPANPRVIYVPVYDPTIVYVRQAGYYGPRSFLSFGIGYPVGPWFIYDTDWARFRLVYTGWIGDGWIGRSRPYVVMSPIYVHERYRVPVHGRGWGGGPFGYRPAPRTRWDGGGYRGPWRGDDARGEPRGERRDDWRREPRGESRREERGNWDRGSRGERRGDGRDDRGPGSRGESRTDAPRTAVPRGGGEHRAPGGEARGGGEPRNPGGAVRGGGELHRDDPGGGRGEIRVVGGEGRGGEGRGGEGHGRGGRSGRP